MRQKATAARLEAAAEGFDKPENIMEALAREEMIIIHHNHAIASELRREQTRFSRLLPEDDALATEGEESKLDAIISVESLDGMPLLADYGVQQDWAELFHASKTTWMGWEGHLIEKSTEPVLEQPETSQMGEVFQKMQEWKALPYRIVDGYKLQELVDGKVKSLAKRLGVSLDVAHAVLLRNSWDEAAATEAYNSEPNYV